MGIARRKAVQPYLWALYALPMAAAQLPSPAPTLAARDPDSPSVGDFALSLLHSLYPSSTITNINDIQWPSTLPTAVDLPSVIELPSGVTLPTAITLPTNFPSVININNGASTVTLTPSSSSTSSSTSSLSSSSTLSTVVAKPTSTTQTPSPSSTLVAADPKKHSNTGRLVGIILGTILGVALLLLLLLLFLLLRRNKRRSGSYFHRRPKTNHGSPYATPDENPTMMEYSAHPAYTPIVAPAVTHQNSRRGDRRTYDEMMARDPFDDHLAQISRLEPQRDPQRNSGGLKRKPLPTATASYVPVSSDPFNEPSYMYANQDTSYQHHQPQQQVHPAFREPTIPQIQHQDSGNYSGNSSESLSASARRAPTPLDMMHGLDGDTGGNRRVSYVEDNAPYVPARSPRRSRVHHPSTSEISDFDFGFQDHGHEYGSGLGNGNGGYGRRMSNGGRYYSPAEVR